MAAIQGEVITDKKAFLNEKVKIEIHKTKEKGAVDPVPVGVNGRLWTIKRGTVVEVPRFIAQVLEDAKEIHYEQILDERTGESRLEPRESLSYPFSYR